MSTRNIYKLLQRIQALREGLKEAASAANLADARFIAENALRVDDDRATRMFIANLEQ